MDPAKNAKMPGTQQVAKLNALGISALSGAETTLLPRRAESTVKPCRKVKGSKFLQKQAESHAVFTAIPVTSSSPALLHR